MNKKLRFEGRKAVKGLLKLDKMQLIYWLLKAHQRDVWLLECAAGSTPGRHLRAANELADMLEEAKVRMSAAHNNFLRFCGSEKWWVCPTCGVFTDREEISNTGFHEKGCTDLCSYKVSACDFFEEEKP